MHTPQRFDAPLRAAQSRGAPGLDLQAAQPGSKRLGDPRSQDGIAVVGLDCGVQNRTPPATGDRCSTRFAINCWSFSMPLPCSSTCNKRALGGLPGAVEGLCGMLLPAREVTVDFSFFRPVAAIRSGGSCLHGLRRPPKYLRPLGLVGNSTAQKDDSMRREMSGNRRKRSKTLGASICIL